MDLRVFHPFEPIVFKDTEILILGTFPSIDSCKKSFYYSHPRNQFWKILSKITNYPINTKEQKIALLKLKRWGVWDMVASCSRENSLDSSLKSVKVNDIPKFLDTHKLSINHFSIFFCISSKLCEKETKSSVLLDHNRSQDLNQVSKIYLKEDSYAP